MLFGVVLNRVGWRREELPPRNEIMSLGHLDINKTVVSVALRNLTMSLQTQYSE